MTAIDVRQVLHVDQNQGQRQVFALRPVEHAAGLVLDGLALRQQQLLDISGGAAHLLTHKLWQRKSDLHQIDCHHARHGELVASRYGKAFYWKATSSKLRSLRLCRRSEPPSRNMSTARMPMRKC